MTLRKLFYWFWTTTMYGVISALVSGLFMLLFYKDFNFMEQMKPGVNLANIAFVLIGGALFAVLSQMGFFSYLILRYIIVGFIRSRWMWEVIQILLIGLVFVDSVYLRYTTSESGKAWPIYTLLPFLVLVVGLIISYFKMKQTNAHAFIPTLFFMFVVTLLEMVPVLKLDSPPSHIFMLIPLLFCNAWQILLLHKLLKPKGKDTVAVV